MSNGPEQRPEVYSENQQLNYTSLKMVDVAYPTKVYQFFYLPKDDRAKEDIKWILTTKGNIVNSFAISTFQISTKGCAVVREIPQSDRPRYITVTYDLPRWPTSDKITCKGKWVCSSSYAIL